MTPLKHLIVNGDDFGQSPGITEGIIRVRSRGVLTSASLMVRWPAARQAAAYAAAHPTLGVGLHLDFGEWRYSEIGWTPIYEVVSLEDAAAVRIEAIRQLELFRRLLDRDPTHLDSHQHVHRLAPIRTVLRELADELNVPLRGCSPVRYCGEFYGQDDAGSTSLQRVRVEGFVDILRALPPGITELVCHPSACDDVDSMYRKERQRELETLCDPRVALALMQEQIQLISFADVLQPARIAHFARVR